MVLVIYVNSNIQISFLITEKCRHEIVHIWEKNEYTGSSIMHCAESVLHDQSSTPWNLIFIQIPLGFLNIFACL